MSFLANFFKGSGAAPQSIESREAPMIQMGAMPAGGPQDIVLLVDVSVSMNHDDYPPSRLEAAKRCAADFVDIRQRMFPNDQVGVVVFESRAHVVCPVVPLQRAGMLKAKIRGIWSGGTTNMVAGLRLARQILNPATAPGQSTIILLTDGCHNGGQDPIRLANELKAAGIRLLAIGIGGSPEGVNEGCLLNMVSSLDNGQPGYRFIADSTSLASCFRSMAETRLVRW